jgi:hypothetical protein
MRYEERVDILEIEREMARLDAVYAPLASQPIDVDNRDDPESFKNAVMNMGAAIEADRARLAVDDQAEAILRAVVELYVAGDEAVRPAIRRLFGRYTSFRWAAQLPGEWNTADEFRARLVHLSARDQDADTRDEILTLKNLCDRARKVGIDVDPILDEVAAMSSDEDRWGMGSMRSIIANYGKGRSA